MPGLAHIGEDERGPCPREVLYSLEGRTEMNQIIVQMNVR